MGHLIDIQTALKPGTIKFSDFVYSDDCIEKSHQNLLDYNQVLLKRRFAVYKRADFFW